MVSPYEAFSTLQPAKIASRPVSTAAPTRNRLYGQYARDAAWRAAAIRSAMTGSGILIASRTDRIRRGFDRARQLLDADSIAEVAKGFPVPALVLEAGENRNELGHDAIVRNVILELGVEPVAGDAPAQKDR